MFIDVVSANTIASLLQGEIDERKRERKREPSVDSTSFACRLCSFLCYSCRRVRQGVGIRGDRDTFVLSSTGASLVSRDSLHDFAHQLCSAWWEKLVRFWERRRELEIEKFWREKNVEELVNFEREQKKKNVERVINFKGAKKFWGESNRIEIDKFCQRGWNHTE